MEVKISYLKLLKLLSRELSHHTNMLALSAASGISNSPWCLRETAEGQLGKAHWVPWGWWGQRCKYHSMECPASTHCQVSHIPMSLHEDTSGTAPAFHHAPEQSVALANSICKQDLGGKFTLEALKTQYLGWQHLSENKSDPHFVFFSLS